MPGLLTLTDKNLSLGSGACALRNAGSTRQCDHALLAGGARATPPTAFDSPGLAVTLQFRHSTMPSHGGGSWIERKGT
jgi:hypothetical protein